MADLRIAAIAAVLLASSGSGVAVSQDDLLERFLTPAPQERQRIEQVEIPVAQERQIGEQQFIAFEHQLRRQGIRFHTSGRDHRYVRQLVTEIRPLMSHHQRYPKIRVWIAQTDVTDAHAFPGGRVVITSGMLEFTQSEAALVGVLAHELSHIDRGHQLESLRSFLAAQNSWKRGSLDDLMAGGRLMMNAFARPFRPEQETQADRDAVRWMMKLGYHPDALADLFERLADRDRGRRVPLPGFLRSHPWHEERQRDVRQYAAQEARKTGVRLDQLDLAKEHWKDRRPRRLR